MKSSLSSCSYPFRSPEVKDMCENLTQDEAFHLKKFSWVAGGLFGDAVDVFDIVLLYPNYTGALGIF